MKAECGPSCRLQGASFLIDYGTSKRLLHMPCRINSNSIAAPYLKGLAGVVLPLPVLEAMGKEVAEETPRRFCALYVANGMSLPKPEKHGIDEWSWFPRQEKEGKFVFGKSTEPLEPLPNSN